MKGKVSLGSLAAASTVSLCIGLALGSLRPASSWAQEKYSVPAGRYQAIAFTNPQKEECRLVVLDTMSGAVVINKALPKGESWGKIYMSPAEAEIKGIYGP